MDAKSFINIPLYWCSDYYLSKSNTGKYKIVINTVERIGDEIYQTDSI
jgi:hypothetical protein